MKAEVAGSSPVYHPKIFYDFLQNLVYNVALDMKRPSRLHKAYSSYKKKKVTKNTLLGAFRSAMPEIILRTTKLEGEPITLKIVNALFK